jgi:hypothetical protein
MDQFMTMLFELHESRNFEHFYISAGHIVWMNSFRIILFWAQASDPWAKATMRNQGSWWQWHESCDNAKGMNRDRSDKWKNERRVNVNCLSQVECNNFSMKHFNRDGLPSHTSENPFDLLIWPRWTSQCWKFEHEQLECPGSCQNSTLTPILHPSKDWHAKWHSRVGGEGKQCPDLLSSNETSWVHTQLSAFRSTIAITRDRVSKVLTKEASRLMIKMSQSAKVIDCHFEREIRALHLSQMDYLNDQHCSIRH